LRHTWAFKGEQALVPITGRNAKRVLFGVINFRTGYRIVLRQHQQGQEDFQAFLRLLRKQYRNRPIVLLLDKASCHEAVRSQLLVVQLDVELIWLPKQWSELNAMDHLWRELKRNISSNRQFKTIDELAEYAEKWILDLSEYTALKKAGILSINFWLKNL
jgi:DDE superfamily endonuclease.